LVPHDEVPIHTFFWLATSERGAEGEKEWTTPLLAMANAATMEDLANIIVATDEDYDVMKDLKYKC